MSWSERFGSKLSGQRNAVANDSAALGGRTSRISHLSERGADSASGIPSAVNGVRPIRSRMLGFDHALLWVTIALLGARPGDGLFGVDRAARQPEVRALPRDHFLVRHLISVAIGDRRRGRRVPDSGVGLGEVRAVALRRRAAAAGRRADSARRQGRQRRAPLDPARHHELPAVRARQARDGDVRRQLHGAQDGRARRSFVRAVLPMAVAVGVVGVLLLAEPDMGAFMVIAAIAMGILFLGGVNGACSSAHRAHVLVGASSLMIVSVAVAARAHLRLPRSVGRPVRAGQGLPAVALADRVRPRRDLRLGPRRQRREAALPARGAHRLPARGDRRGARLRRRARRDPRCSSGSRGASFTSAARRSRSTACSPA